MWNIKKIISKGKYNYALVPAHPNSTKNGYVLEHRVVMENYLGRLLDADEISHHIDEDKKNNSIENLELCLRRIHTKFYHKHGRKMVKLKCPNCKIIFIRRLGNSFIQKGSEYSCCSMSCRGKFNRFIQLNGRTHAVEQAISENLVAHLGDDDSEQTV